MKNLSRFLLCALIIMSMIFPLFSLDGIYENSNRKIKGEVEIHSFEGKITTNKPYNEISRASRGYLKIEPGNSTTLGPADGGNYTGIWVQEGATLVLNGSKVNVIQGTDGHQGEFNVSRNASIRILGGSEVMIEKGNFSVRAKEFLMEDSKLTVVNVTGGEEGDSTGTGIERDGKRGNDSIVEIITTWPVTISNSEISCYGKTGGTGAAGIDEKKMNGGHGGNGGKAEIIIEAAKVDITNGSKLKASGGDGGKGGEGVPTESFAKGGDGGVGGKGIVIIDSKGSIALKGSEFIAMAGGGGDASRTSGDELHGKGGWGGESNIRIYAYTSVKFEYCFIYSIGGDMGMGGNRNVDGYYGKDRLRLIAINGSIEGYDSQINTSADSFGMDCPANTNILDNVSISNRVGDLVKPYSILESVIELYWDISVKVVDDYTKKGISGTEVEIRAKDESDEWEMLVGGETDQYGYAYFESILSRIIKGNDTGKDLIVRIHAMKHTYTALEQFPLNQSLDEKMALKILSLDISSIQYRGVLVGYDELVNVNINDVISGVQPLGGITYINGTAQIFSTTQQITKIEVYVDGASGVEVDDISESERAWSKWSYRFETASKSGTNDKTKINYYFDNKAILFRFVAFEGHGFTTETNIISQINQSKVNNPPFGTITKINGEEVDSEGVSIITLPPDREKIVVVEGSYFDIDGDSIASDKVWVRMMPADAGKTVVEPLISEMNNTIIDPETKTWTVNLDLKFLNFEAGNYIMSVDIGDERGLKTSDSDHFEIETFSVDIYLESNPKAVITKVGETLLNEYWNEKEEKFIFFRPADRDPEDKEGNKKQEAVVNFNASNSSVPDVGIEITNYIWVVTDMHTNEEIANVDTGLGKTFSFTFTVNPNEKQHEYEVQLKVKDRRGYTSITTRESKVTLYIEYVPRHIDPDPDNGNLSLYLVIIVIVVILIALLIIVIRQKKRRNVLDEENHKISHNSDENVPRSGNFKDREL